MGERERDAIGELLLYRRDHVGIVVAQDDRAERHHVVDVLVAVHVPHVAPPPSLEEVGCHPLDELDRKSTRLNSSHSQISYAVFCLKKKKRKMKLALPSVNTRGIVHHTKSQLQ